jgi:hypothetical protein
MRVGGQRHAPADLPPGIEPRYPQQIQNYERYKQQAQESTWTCVGWSAEFNLLKYICITA